MADKKKPAKKPVEKKTGLVAQMKDYYAKRAKGEVR